MERALRLITDENRTNLLLTTSVSGVRCVPFVARRLRALCVRLVVHGICAPFVAACLSPLSVGRRYGPLSAFNSFLYICSMYVCSCMYVCLYVPLAVYLLSFSVVSVVCLLPPHAARLLAHTRTPPTHRHVHIGLDTLVLYSALGVTTRPDHNSSNNNINNMRPNDGGAPAVKAKSESSYDSGEFHHHHHPQQNHYYRGGAEASLRVTADEAGRRWGSGPIAMTSSSSSPDYIPEDEAC